MANKNFASCVLPSGSCTAQQEALSPAVLICCSTTLDSVAFGISSRAATHPAFASALKSSCREQRFKAKKLCIDPNSHISECSHGCPVAPAVSSSFSLWSCRVLHSSSLLSSFVFSSVPSLEMPVANGLDALNIGLLPGTHCDQDVPLAEDAYLLLTLRKQEAIPRLF